MAADLFRAELVNSVSGVGNPAIVDFSFSTAGAATDAEITAGIVAYLAALGAQSVLAPGVYITGVSKRPSGSPGSLPMAFPTTEYGVLDGLNGAALPAMTAWNVVIGVGTAYEPLGTSITVSLYTATPGRATTGRHYLPWISTDVNDGNGHLLTATGGVIVAAYLSFIRGQTVSPFVGNQDLSPVVQSATAGTNGITTTIVSPNFARLKTRTR